ncbi:exonuclease [Candidatus Pacearchaeota archaeon]|nr:exonuclease [Candidatus Pacearchaeota archaeon]
MVDIESDGPIPGEYSMLSLGAVIMDEKLDKSFHINILPISNKFEEERLNPNDFPRDDLKNRVPAKKAMEKFYKWIKKNSVGKPKFISDNNGYDWMFVCWYFWKFLNKNPFGFSSYNLQSLYKGLKKDIKAKIEELREEKLTHNAEQDAIDNGKIFLKILAIAKKKSKTLK